MFVLLLGVVCIAPFERALFTLPGSFTITTVEGVTLVTLAFYAASRVRRCGPVPFVPTSLRWAGIAFIAALTVAAVASPLERGNALRFVSRIVVAATLLVMTCEVVNTRDRARFLARGMLVVATFVAAVAVLEAMQVGVVMNALTVFRPGFHVVAGQLRATSTLPYPTIASMYLEVAFVIGLWLLLESSRQHRVLPRMLVFAALLTIGAGISVTFTRAGLLAMAAALAAVAALRFRRPERTTLEVRQLSALGAALIVIVFLSHSPELLAARVTTEGSESWYGARYDVPRTAAMRTAGIHRVPLAITNTGRLTWNSQNEPSFALSYHWLRADESVIEFEGQRTLFPEPIRPGERASVAAAVIAPGEPGSYVLVWDVVHETRAWLSTEGVTPARTQVEVSGEPTAVVTSQMQRLPPAMLRPARPELWSAALRMASERPLLGIGPDNYRLAYGAYLGSRRWDPRVHANSMYLEILAGAGVVGVATLLWLIVAVAVLLYRRLQTSNAPAHAAAATAVALWVVIAGHGIVDSFLSFTPTYVMFAIAVGWALSPGLVERVRDAHRV